MTRSAPRARPIALAGLSLIAGLLVGLREPALGFFPAAGLAALVFAAAAIRWNRRGHLIISSLITLAIAGALLGQVEQRLARQDCRTAWAVGHPVSIAGIALSYMPAGERGAIRIRPTAPPAEGCRWVGPIRVWTDGPAIPGTVYRVDGTWRPARYLRSARRPPERWGWVAVDSMIPLRPARVREHPILMARGATAEGIWRVYPRRWAPLAEALVLGQRAMVSHEVSERLARSGLAHLLAISGLHVGLLAIAFFCLARAARLPSKGAHVCTVVCVFAYVLLIGAPASAVRAALIILLWTLSRLAGRASSPYDTLGLAAIIIILMKPWSVVEPGFQLSFAGACAVGFAHSEVRRFSWLRSRPSVVRALALGMAASTAAVLLTAPITARYFGHVALAGIVGNLVAVPLLGLTMPALFASALLSPWAPLAAWPASAAVVLLQLIDGLAGFLSGIQWASLDLPPPNDLATLCYVVLLILAAHTLHGAWYRRRFIHAVGLALALLIVWSPVQARLVPPTLRIYVVDVGQGEAIAIATPGKRWLLLDSGPRTQRFDAGERRVVPFLKAHGVRRLEAWLVSHPDLDHIGGGPAVLDAVDVDRLISPGRVTGQIGQIAVLEWLAKTSRPWLRAAGGSRMSLDGVDFTFIHPPRTLTGSSSSHPNALSLIFLLEFGNFRMLFTGDAPGEVEDRLSRERSGELRAQVLKVAHHGSASSTSSAFLTSVDPQLAIISVGRGNRYGHPSPYVLRRLGARDIEVRRSDRDGTLMIEAHRDGSWRLEAAAGRL